MRKLPSWLREPYVLGKFVSWSMFMNVTDFVQR
ncbi:hypothetical protein Pla52n_56240 [Stieleria varia]|uniref:Uncharacterized protein n=1 Tax=Stieleria varia TaxID=2528005 RepID=A0A5C6A317_9BACT|nr:hypothetical protein Pla52n_56240 [Stieleria varia]